MKQIPLHIALNAWFWDRPDTGSGQYLRLLVAGLRAVAPDLGLTLIAPDTVPINAPEGVGVKTVALKGKGHLAKLRFEQQDFPQMAAGVGAHIAHVPYWGSPLQSPIPVVVTIHDLIPLILPAYRGGVLARLYTGVVAASARGAAAVITDSEASREDILTHLKLRPDIVYSIPLSVGGDYHPKQGSIVDMAIRKKYNLPAEYLLYLGGYDIRKNILRMLQSYAYIQKGYDIPLVLAGRLPKKQSPRFWDVPALLDELDLTEKDVLSIGWIDEDDKPALLRMASCFIFPSRYEGFGLPPLEAMACGTPVVSTTTSSIPEVVGDAGFLVEPDDIRKMAGSVLALLTEDNLAEEMRQKGIRRAGTFSQERTASETLRVYMKVTGLS